MIKEVFIWSKWLRIIHGVFIASVLVLLLSGWLINQQYGNFQDNLMLHQVGSSFIGFFLVFRLLLLLFGKGAENFKSFFNQAEKLKQTRTLMAFYFSLTKLPLPNWHSKSALWSILYLVMFVLMALVLATGILMAYQDMLWGFILLDVHLWLVDVLLGLLGFHIISAIAHDVKSNHANISAMLNGRRYFYVDDTKPSEVTVKFK